MAATLMCPFCSNSLGNAVVSAGTTGNVPVLSDQHGHYTKCPSCKRRVNVMQTPNYAGEVRISVSFVQPKE